MTIQKNIDYILGMITEALLMIATWAECNIIQEIKVLNQSWELVYMDIVD